MLQDKKRIGLIDSISAFFDTERIKSEQPTEADESRDSLPVKIFLKTFALFLNMPETEISIERCTSELKLLPPESLRFEQVPD